jgi:GT2 family glycosyltransferase
VVPGTAEGTVDGVLRLVHEKEAAYLPIGCMHRLVNPGKVPPKQIEVNCCRYTSKDIITRINAIYGCLQEILKTTIQGCRTMQSSTNSPYKAVHFYDGSAIFLSHNNKFGNNFKLNIGDNLYDIERIYDDFDKFVGQDNILKNQNSIDMQFTWTSKAPLPPSVHLGINFSESTNYTEGHTAHISGKPRSSPFCLTYTDDIFGNLIPAFPNTTYRMRGLFAAHRALGKVNISFLDIDKREISKFEENIIEKKGGSDLSDWLNMDFEFISPQFTKYIQINICFVGSYNEVEDMNFFIFFNGINLNIIKNRHNRVTNAAESGWTHKILSISCDKSNEFVFKSDLDIDYLNNKNDSIYLTDSNSTDDPILIYDIGPILNLTTATIDLMQGRILNISTNNSMEYSVYCDNTKIAYINSHKDTVESIKLPDNILDGRHHLFDVRDTSGLAIIAREYFIVPYVSMPWYLLQEHSFPQPPSYLAPSASYRYRALQAHLENSTDPIFYKQLHHAHQVLTHGFEFNNDFRSLKFDSVSNPTVSIVIPVHNKFEVTYFCLCALLVAYNKTSYEVIIVDDCSSDRTKDICLYVEGISVIRNNPGLGFVGACNEGAKIAKGKYILFLNNDTEPAVGWIDELINSFEKFENVGLAGSKLIYPNGTLQEAGGIVWGSGNPWNYGRGQNPHEPRFCYTREADYLSGAAIMLPKHVWDKIGGFSQEFMPAYFEDTDLAFKVRDIGLKTLYVSSSIVFHFEGVTGGTDISSGAKRNQEINRPKFKKKWARSYRDYGTEGLYPDLEKDRGIEGRALFVDYQFPKLNVDAGSYAAIQEIRLIQALGYKVSFCPQNFAYLGKHTEYLQRNGVETFYAPFYQSMADVFKKHGKDFDIIYMTRYYVAKDCIDLARQYAPQAKLIMNNADLHFLRELRAGVNIKDEKMIEKALRVREEELSIMKKVDLVLSYNAVEHAVIMSHNLNATPVMHVPWVEQAIDDIKTFENRSDIAFLGGFNHHPNVEAVRFFAREVMPLLISKSNIKFNVYGSNVKKEIELMSNSNVIVKGYVEDIDEIFNNCRVFVAPLISGAGVKGKVLSALAHGVPCVLSPIAAEGIGLRHGYDCLIANTHDEWVEYILKIYNDVDLWNNISHRGMELIKQDYSFESGLIKMKKALEEIGIYTAS